MAAPKTIPTSASVSDYIAAVPDERKRADAVRLDKIMQELSGHTPVMWGPSIIGYGSYHYKYASGHEGDWPEIGFSPRKSALSLYIMSGANRYKELLDRLGKYKTGKSCLYIKRLSDIDLDVLREMISKSLADTRNASVDYGVC